MAYYMRCLLEFRLEILIREHFTLLQTLLSSQNIRTEPVYSDPGKFPLEMTQ